MATAGTAYIELRAKLDQFERDLKSAEGRVTSSAKTMGQKVSAFGKQASVTGRRMTVGLTAPIVALGGVMVKAASDLDESMNKVTVVFGESADEIKAWAKTAATSLGISRQEALESAGTFGNLFTAMEIATPQATKMSKGMIQLASDLASFNNANPEDTLLALRSGLVGEVEPLRKFGVNLSAARVEVEALRLGLVKEGDELDAAAKAQAAYSLILQDTTTAQGDFARTADGAANKQRILNAQAKDGAAQFGKALKPALETVQRVAAVLLEKFNSLSPRMQKVIIVTVGLVAALGPLLAIIGSLIGITTALGITFTAVGVAMTLGIGVAVAAIVAAVVLIIKNWDKIKEAVSNAVDAVVGFVRALPGRILSALAGLGNLLYQKGRDMISGLIGGIKDAASGIGSAIGGAVSNAVGALNPFGGAGAGKLGGNLVSIGRSLQAQGFSVGEHPAFGGVDPVHTAGSYHYIGRAIDINWPGPDERTVLTGLGMKFQASLSGIKELLGPWNDPNHQSHLHLAMDYGGIVKGPAMIAQGNITEAHIPLTGPGAQGFSISGTLHIPGIGPAILEGARLEMGRANHRGNRLARLRANG